jgi:hypothetical protein
MGRGTPGAHDPYLNSIATEGGEVERRVSAQEPSIARIGRWPGSLWQRHIRLRLGLITISAQGGRWSASPLGPQWANADRTDLNNIALRGLGVLKAGFSKYEFCKLDEESRPTLSEVRSILLCSACMFVPTLNG